MVPTKRYLGLFGPRASGKTVYLGAFYGSAGAGDDEPAYHVAASDAPDDPTHLYLGRIARVLAKGKWPDSTGTDYLTKMQLRFTRGELARAVVLPELSGELTARPDGEQEGEGIPHEAARQNLLDEYAHYHGFLILFPADITDPNFATDCADYKWRVDVLLTRLLEAARDGRAIARPVAVLVTKWDLIEPGPLTAEAEVRAAALIERSHPELLASLRVVCSNLRVFPVSATGPTVNGYPPTPLCPVNLGAPIAWLIETAERVLLDNALGYLDRHRGNLFRRDPESPAGGTSWHGARERLQAFLADVPHGPLADEARAQLQALAKLARARMIRRSVAFAAIIVITALAVSGFRDHAEFVATTKLLANPPDAMAPEDVTARADAVVGRSFLTRPIGHIMGWWRTLRVESGGYRRRREARDLADLERLAPPADEAGARALLAKVEEFLGRWPNSPDRPQVLGWEQVAQRRIKEVDEAREFEGIQETVKAVLGQPNIDGKSVEQLIERCTKFLQNSPTPDHGQAVTQHLAQAQAEFMKWTHARLYETLQADLNKSANDPWRCYELCTKFLQEAPEHPRAQQVRDDQARLLGKADDAAFAALEKFQRGDPSKAEDLITDTNSYLANPRFEKHRPAVNSMKQRAIRKLDELAYEEVYHAGRSGSDPATLRSVYTRCKAYLDKPLPIKCMTDDVKKWITWKESWDRGRAITIRVVAVRIDRGSTWHHYWWNYNNPLVHAEVRVGSRVERTESRSIPLGRDVRNFTTTKLGPFNAQWDESDVAVTMWHEGANPDHYTTNFAAQDAFRVGQLNGPIWFDEDRIHIRLSCPEVVPPPLPPFRGN